MTLFDLARKNIKGNFRNYFVYFVSMLFSVVIYYVFASLQHSTEIVRAMETSASMLSVFMIASIVLIVFVAIFIWYSNQFFARKRKKEVGLYALLGLPKRTIGRMLFYENMIIGVIVLVIGIAAGTLLSKLFSMIFVRLLGLNVDVGMTFSLQALVSTVIVFAVIILFTSLQAYRLIYRFKLIELFRAEKEGEQEPQASALSAILAALCLVIGYGFAFRDFSNNQDILLNLGVMTAGIIVGTVLLFSSLVIFLLKAVKRNKHRYYNGMNLVITSNLVYRMKGNARSLSIISLLSAAALCAFSFGFASYYGYEQSARLTAPFSYMHIAQDDAYNARVDSIIREDEAHPIRAKLSIPVLHMKGEASSEGILSEREISTTDNPIKVVAESAYNRAAEALGFASLDVKEQGEAIAVRPMYSDLERADYEGETITLAKPDGSITLGFVGMTVNRIVNWSYPDIMIVVSDDQYELLEAAEVQPAEYIGYIVQGQKTAKETSDALAGMKTEESKLSTFYAEYRVGIETAALNLFILGFLGLVFVTALGSMIYFKQLTEAGEDKPRYGILSNIGVSSKDLGTAIIKQIALIFLLPLIVGLAHYVVILQWLKRLFGGLGDVGLLTPIIICIAVFVAIYAVYYVLTVHSISKLIFGETVRSIRVAMLVIVAGVLVLIGIMLFSQPPVKDEETYMGDKLTLQLPEPTGRYKAGTIELHLKDEDRADPWVDEQPRELMISIWYPAAEAMESGEQALYMQPGAAAHYDETEIAAIGIEPGRIDLSGIDTHAWLNAPAAENDGEGWPVIVYSPGGTVPRSFGTIIVSELASRGYIVVTVDHTHEAVAVEFPDGRVLTEQLPAFNAQTVLKMLAVRVDDVRYVLDQLTALQVGDMHDFEAPQLPDGLLGSLDLSKVGIFGHSAGGATSAQAMYEDERFDAGIDMDGTMGYMPDHPLPVAREGLDRPFMLINAGYNDDGVDSHLTAEDRASFWEHSSGWKKDISIPRGAHFSLIDYQHILPGLSTKLSISSQVIQGSVGTADPDQVVEALRAYVTAFFDLHLKGIPQPLLELETSPYEEAKFIH